MMTMANQPMNIFNFNTSSNINTWQVVDDVVMGGRSAGEFYLDQKGNGVFKGEISLENNGGFSSVRYRFEKANTKNYTKVTLRVKGDGKKYQFRIKNKASDSYSYITTFSTTKDWETISLNLLDMYPSFRGRILDMPNYDKANLEEIAFLIGNKKAEKFELKIDFIKLE
jgi:hypothetical protein